MHRLNQALCAMAAGLAALALSAPAGADTSVAQFDKLEKREQAHLLGSLIQSLVEDLDKNKRGQEAECLIRLYTNQESEARVIKSPGMVDFLATLDAVRQKEPDKITIEEIIARQMVQNCGSGKPNKG
jgi:hypothetical protein